MTASGPSRLARQFALELDVLRGIAAILMVVNHAGYRLLSADDAVHSAVAPAVFLGSAAPAVFFFATGFGIGLSRSTPPRAFDWLGLLWKAALLIVADQFFYWGRGASFGLDFFSFIAIATITVSLLSQLRYAIAISVFVGAALLVLRYGLAPSLAATDHPVAFVEWLLGVRTVSDVSYPLSPWMVFPLLGFALGCSYKNVSLTAPLPRNQWIRRGAVVFGVCCASTLCFQYLNRGFFRWGTVSVAYFIFAAGVVVIAGLSSMAAVMYGRNLKRTLALRGVASFAVIPLHYAMLEVISQLHPQPFASGAFALITGCLVAASFFCSNKFASVVSTLTIAKHPRALFCTLIALVSALCIGLNFEHIRAAAPTALVTMLAQLAVAVLLGLGLPKSRAPVAQGHNHV